MEDGFHADFESILVVRHRVDARERDEDVAKFRGIVIAWRYRSAQYVVCSRRSHVEDFPAQVDDVGEPADAMSDTRPMASVEPRADNGGEIADPETDEDDESGAEESPGFGGNLMNQSRRFRSGG